ncbi:MAG: PSD1 and planctomycete cytochrome C domain-containing protein [Verrucomicrobiota bacterium]
MLIAGCSKQPESSDIADGPKVASVEPISFNRDIRPILSNNCYFCHGPDLENNKADLRLDDRDSAIVANAIVPGSAETSEMIQRILSDDADMLMPPPDSHRKLTDEQKQLLARWIDEGAEYEGHWSYMPVVRPDAASIDEIIEKRLDRRGLAFSPEADKATLLRRVSLDITGLPPTPEQTKAFMEDASETAYEALVDELLASPHYGEKMAIGWLDAVRYADTVGYHGDQNRDATPFRDYVIQAFNTNKPFDQFTIEQIAGDLLPNATLQQKVAASYSRLNQLSEEGGIQDKEYLKKYQSERVRTTSTAWLGSTLACAECHDHKYDPFTAKDFYTFAAFFADVLEKGAWNGNGQYQVNDVEEYLRASGAHIVDTYRSNYGPKFEVPNRTFIENVEEIEAELAARRAKILEASTVADAEFEDWLKARKGYAQPDLPAVYELEAVATDFEIPAGLVDGMTFQIRLQKPNARWGSQVGFQLGFDTGDKFIVWGNTLKREGIETIRKPKIQDENHWLDGGFEFSELNLPEEAILQSIEFVSTKLKDSEDDAYHVRNIELLTMRNRVPIGRLSELDGERLDQYTAGEGDESTLAELRTAYMLEHSSNEELVRLRAEYDLLDEFLNGSRKTLATISATPREIRVLNRGNWMDETGEIVLPETPHFLPEQRTSSEGQPLTRLDLAEWIVSPGNPLTARAFVNRVWGEYFGTALSKAPEDLGLQGEYPVYPELLDWLASEFVESGWDVKHIVRTIVLSRAYQQSSLASPELLELDPYNRLLARQSPRRLPAELIRDNALSASGLLVDRIGGASVKPYQPEGYYEHLNFPRRTYESDLNENQYRRGVYMHWQRTFLHPMLVAFDAPGRDECAVDRPLSNTPLQALNLLNDPTFLEAAKALAEQVYQVSDRDSDRIHSAFVRVLAREPSEQEETLLRDLLLVEQERFSAAPNAAKEFLGIGQHQIDASLPATELAAWMSVCRAVLNLNETITRY